MPGQFSQYSKDDSGRPIVLIANITSHHTSEFAEIIIIIITVKKAQLDKVSKKIE